jgi:hypothetical protein
MGISREDSRYGKLETIREFGYEDFRDRLS